MVLHSELGAHTLDAWGCEWLWKWWSGLNNCAIDCAKCLVAIANWSVIARRSLPERVIWTNCMLKPAVEEFTLCLQLSPCFNLFDQLRAECFQFNDSLLVSFHLVQELVVHGCCVNRNWTLASTARRGWQHSWWWSQSMVQRVTVLGDWTLRSLAFVRVCLIKVMLGLVLRGLDWVSGTTFSTDRLEISATSALDVVGRLGLR